MGELNHSIESNQRALILAREVDAPQERKRAYEALSKSMLLFTNAVIIWVAFWKCTLSSAVPCISKYFPLISFNNPLNRKVT